MLTVVGALVLALSHTAVSTPAYAAGIDDSKSTILHVEGVGDVQTTATKSTAHQPKLEVAQGTAGPLGLTPSSTLATSCIVAALPNDNSTSGNARAPSTRFRGAKVVYLIKQSELAAAGFTAGTAPTQIGWNYQAAPVTGGSGPLKIYMENTPDATNNKSTSFATAIAPMTKVHDATTALPGTVGTFDITFSGGSPFTYTGGGLYIAFEWGNYTGTLSTTAVIFCNSLGLTNGLLGVQSTTGAAPDGPMAASNFRPETRLASTIQNDISVDYLIADGQVPLGLVGAQTVQAIVTNRGANDQSNIPVTLTVSGAQSFSNTQTIPSLVGCGGSATVTFASFTPSTLGTDVLSVSVDPDDINSNNNVTRNLAVTVPTYSYKHPASSPAGGVGVTGATATFLAKLTVTGPTAVTQVIPEFFATSATRYRVAVYGDDGFGGPGAQLYLDAADRIVSAAGPVTITLPSPIPFGPGNIFVGIQQTNTTNASLSFDNETPIRANKFYLEVPIGSGFLEANADEDNFKFNIGATLDRCDGTAAATNNGPICSGQTLQLFGSATNGLTWSWTGPAGFTSNLQNPTIPNATTANSGTYFLSVNGCATTVSTNAVVTPPYTINATAGSGGSISPSGAVSANCGTDKTFTITAASCYHILDVTVDGSSIGPVSSYTFTNVQANHTIDAQFAFNAPSTITATAGAGGTITPSGSTTVNCGDSQTYSIAADACHSIADVKVDGVSVGAVASYTFTNVQTNHTIDATFALINYTINATSGPNGSISPSGSTTVGCGNDQAYTVTPAAGYHVEDVLVDGSSVGAVTSYTFLAVSASHTIHATFGVEETAVIDVQSASSGICPANPCQTLPVTIARGSSTPVLGFSIRIKLSANLALCGSGISEGTFLSSAGATTFLVTPKPGNEYVVDGAVLGNDCGPTATAGLLFNVAVTSGDAGGSGSISVVSAELRDCNNVSLPTVLGSTGTVAIDNTAPTVTVIAPNGGELYPPGSTQPITWTAADNAGVSSIDLAYSTDGGATYSPIASGLANSGSYAWLVPNTPSNQARVRVTAHDTGCSSSSDASDANFTISDLTITATAGPGGSISPSGAVSVPYGGSQTFTITPDACQSIADVTVDGNSVGPVASYTFTNVQANHTIHATFTTTIYTITASAGSGGSIAPSGAVAVSCGSDQAFSITADPCFAIADVLVDGSSVGPVASYTFTNVQSNHTIAASFVSTTQATTTTLASSPSPSVCQQDVTLTATIAPASATGSVEFFDGATSLGTSAVSGGSASLLVSGGFSVGSHSLKAVYTPTGCYSGSQGLKTHTVQKATPGVTITSDINPSYWNQTVTFTATVTPSTATGTITFKDSVTTFAVVPLSGGQAQATKSNLTPGNHTQITATYSGDACYNAKTAVMSQQVNRAPTTVSVTSNINPSSCGQTIQLIAQVNPVGATNRVFFFDNGNLIGSAAVNALTGVATLNVSNFLTGKHDITGNYQGDTKYLPSTSAVYSQVVNAAPSTTTLTSDVNPSKEGEQVTFTATVSPSDATGSVTFLDGATPIGSAPLSGGTATLSTTSLSAGSHSITASFAGDACLAPSNSAAYTQDVTPDAPPQVLVQFPNGGEIFIVGADVKLVWQATDNTQVVSVTLEISRDLGATWDPIAVDIPNSGSFVWHVAPPSTNGTDVNHHYTALLRVTAKDNAGVLGADQSNAGFSIYDYPVAAVITSLGAETVDLGIRIHWALASRTVFTELTLERSAGENGPWATIDAAISEANGETVADDRTAQAGQTYWYRLVGTTALGQTATFGPVKGTAGAPREFALSSAWPNPAKGDVSFNFSVAKAARVKLDVVDLQGRQVSVLADQDFAAGRYQLKWDGRSDRGQVPAGVYFVRLTTAEKKLISRATIAR